MASIRKLRINTFRNLARESLEPGPCVNLVAGENGSGKSSLLEAIYFLGLSRSFRNTQHTPLIQHGERDCAVFGELERQVSLGVSRSLDEPPRLQVQGNKATSAADLARHLPLQLLNAEAFRLLEGGPKTRRQYIDWGVFHVEHGFHDHWRDFKRCLQHRNSLLKRKVGESELAPWTQEFVRHAEAIDHLRQSYLAEFLPYLKTMLASLVTLDDLTFRYYRGWSEDDSIESALIHSLERDRMLGHTSPGPQRADLRIRLGGQNACDILSRGQQKLVVSAMKLAQGAWLAQQTSRQCLYLIDDLPAELDTDNREKVCRLLRELGGQIFITGTEAVILRQTVEKSGFAANEYKVFHVKHGKICPLETTPD